MSGIQICQIARVFYKKGQSEPQVPFRCGIDVSIICLWLQVAAPPPPYPTNPSFRKSLSVNELAYHDQIKLNVKSVNYKWIIIYVLSQLTRGTCEKNAVRYQCMRLLTSKCVRVGLSIF